VSARILVTDAEERAVLGACRGLAAAGYQVSAAARSRPAATHWSRSCAERFVLPDPRDDARAFVAALEELLGRGDYAVLLPGTDASLLAISEHRDRLERLTRLGLPPREAVRRCVDKLVLHRVAAAAGLAPPPSRACAGASEAAVAAAELGYPVLLKPMRSFLQSGLGFKQHGVTVVDDDAGLAKAIESYPARVIVQKFERTGLLSCTGVIADDRLLALTASRVLRLWPPTAGMHTFSVTVAVPAGLADRIRALLGELGWQGIFQLQMLERADGRVSAIDLNPRVFASIALDVHAGANLAAVWCGWVLGERPAPVVASPGYRYRWEEGDLCHFAWQLRHGRIPAAASVLQPHRRVAHAWGRATDPAPLLARALELGLRTAGNKLHAWRRPGLRAAADGPARLAALNEPGRWSRGS
jgi:predicted ATP-grasp superfamily ATP-dependent carboligase